MASSFTPEENTAIAEIGTYNNNPYNPTTNPGGFGSGGHRENFTPALENEIILARAGLRFSNEALDSANAAASASEDFTATSTTSIAIGTGSKTFTIQTGKAFIVGQVLKITDSSDINNQMIGAVSSHNDATGELIVEVTRVSGSGTIASWSISLNSVDTEVTTERFEAITSSGGSVTVNALNANVFSHTLTESTTFTFSNAPASGTAYGFTLKIVQDAGASGFVVNWPASVEWPFSTAPQLTSTANGTDVLVFFTHDGGTTWYGFVSGQELG